ncbi:MAG: transcriptional regulator [Clostridiales bacterium]|nr:MAG: transcriptional regulator [Clostridiales bacterium]
MQKFHVRLRQLRRNKKMTLDALAKALDTTKTTLSRYENNKRLPDADFIAKAALFFNVSTDYILSLSDHPTTVGDFLDTTQSEHAPLTEAELTELRKMVDKF